MLKTETHATGATPHPRDVAWGRAWAAEHDNRGRLRRLARWFEAGCVNLRHDAADVAQAATDLLDLMNRDANGAGTLLARVLNEGLDDDIDRERASEYWKNVSGGHADDIDAVMYGRTGECDEYGEPPTEDGEYGDGPLVGFVVGAMAVWDERR